VPGGQIILTRGLLQRANSSDEVAGVLSHELGHAIELHPEAGLVRAMGLAAAAQLVFAGSTGTATNIGLLLTQLRYTRVAEREADAHAIRILKNAQISPKGFGDFFERLEPPQPPNPPGKGSEAKGASDGKSLGARIFSSELLRTHPLTGQRLALVRAQPDYPATPALSDADWRALRDVCALPGQVGQGLPPPGMKPGPLIGRPAPLPAPAPAPPPPAPKPTPAQSTGPPDFSDADRAIADASRALQSNPYDAIQLQLRARAYTRKGRHADALADYVKASQLRPSDPNLQLARGGAHFALRQYELALVAFDEAIRLDAGNLAARNGRGNTYRALKRYPEAVAEFDALLRMRPDFVFAYYNRGLANIDMGQQEAAIADFTSALAIDRDYAIAYTQRGLAHEKAGARENAIADFRGALAVPPGKYDSGPWAQQVARDRLKALGVEP
jgi:predicted Zn-dependent protease